MALIPAKATVCPEHHRALQIGYHDSKMPRLAVRAFETAMPIDDDISIGEVRYGEKPVYRNSGWITTVAITATIVIIDRARELRRIAAR